MIIKDINLNAYLNHSLPNEMIDKYKEIIQRPGLEENVRMITFEEDEDIHQNRQALKIAAEDLGIPLKITKKRGKSALVFWKISKEEYKLLQKKRQDRASKMRAGKKK